MPCDYIHSIDVVDERKIVAVSDIETTLKSGKKIKIVSSSLCKGIMIFRSNRMHFHKTYLLIDETSKAL
jgi:hypothetical protein